MKKMFLAFVLIIGAQAVLACSNPEAQFIGKVVEYGSDCSFKIDFTRFNPSMICGLSESEASLTKFQDKSCQLKDGDEVSGYLIMQDNQVVID